MARKESDDFEMIVSSKQIAKIFGVTTARIRQLTKENAIVRVARDQYDLAESIQAYIKYMDSKRAEVLDKSIEDALYTRVRREKVELQVQVMKGELHRSEDVERVMNEMLGNFRGKLLSFPPKMASRVVGKTDVSEIRELLKSGINEAMTELTEYDPKDFYSEDVFVEDVDIDE